MASYAAYCFLLAIALMVVDCTAQSTPTSCTPFALGGRQMVFDNCTSLGTLNATLQWTYDATTGSLDTGFSVPPSTADGWVAWGINPSPTGGMAGTQAIISLTNDTRVAKTYNISGNSAATVVQGEISIVTSNISTESTDGMVVIFAKWTLEPNTMMFNPTWQVGPMGPPPGLLQIHGTNQDNLNAYALNVSLATDGGGASSPMTPPSSPMTPPSSQMTPRSAGNMNMINFGAALLSSFVFFWLCCSSI